MWIYLLPFAAALPLLLVAWWVHRQEQKEFKAYVEFLKRKREWEDRASKT